jgi:nicotinate-nucleotide pyrophosphorylase (carboxylating)
LSLKTLDLIKAAFLEDMPSGDITTDSLGLPPRTGTARLIAKENLVLSGQSLFDQSVSFLDPHSLLKWHFDDSDFVLKDQILCSIHGDLVCLLKSERVALNFLTYLSGIATVTRQFKNLTANSSTLIMDTRKTKPGYRDLEKRAVRDGGGLNHRQSLSDSLFIKHNHILLVGNITDTVNRLRHYTDLPITVEVQTLQEVQECIPLQVHRLCLSHFDHSTLKQALKEIPRSIITEVGGYLTKEDIILLSSLGVDYISVGNLTQSAPCAQIQLVFDWAGL